MAILNAYLVETTSTEEIYEVLAHYLPGIGIEHAAVAYFAGETAVDTGQLHVRTILNPTGKTFDLPVRTYSPILSLTQDTAHHLALFPLIVDRQQVGFIVFQTENLAICEIIIRQVTAAMRSVRLYQQAEEGRRLAEEANQMKSRFLSMVSHELRTPLSLVVGLSEMLVQDTRKGQIILDGLRTRQIERIHTSAQHLHSLIQDVLDLTHGDINQLAFEPEPLILQEVLTVTLSIGEQMAADKGLQWSTDLPNRPIAIYGDRGRLRQVLLNVINNAVKFTAVGTIKVTVHLNHDGTIVEIVVKDSGLGVPEADRDMIFEPFQQSRLTVKRGYGGLGLGLAICKHFITLHRGEFGLHPTRPDQPGASFYVRLPVLPIALSPAPPPTTPTQTTEAYVLVIEPQHMPVPELHNHLTREGHQVRVVTNDTDEEIFAAIALAPPHAIILDARIPVQQGWQLFRHLKNNAETQDIPILFYELEQTNNTGAMLTFDYMSKPVDTGELLRILQQHAPLQNEEADTYTILIVDDDPGILEMHAQMIQRQWPMYHTRQARNGREALTDMRKSPPNLVLLDLMMPEVDGFEVLATMRQEEALRHIPVIVLTANVLTEAEMDRLHQGVSTVLKKGVFSVAETLHHIQEALAHAQKLGDEKRRLVRHAMAYIHEHFTEQITREDIAVHIGVSQGYLSRSFHDELGIAPITYLNRYRVNQAKRLLTEAQQTITNVAHAVGFTDGNYFSRVFRREVGESPKVYRVHHTNIGS